MSEKQTVIIIRETAFEGVVSDISTFCIFVGLIGLGWLLGSSAMQWAGFIIGCLYLLSRASGMSSKNKMTIAQARKKLDELERGGTHP